MIDRDPVPSLFVGRPPKGFCGSCGGELDDGECPFCAAFDEVMGQ